MDLIYKELPTVLPFYDKRANQNMNRENVAKNCIYELISPKDSLLPFQLLLPAEMYAKPTKWSVFTLGGIEIDLTRNLSFIFDKITENGAYFVYNGEVLEFAENVSLNLDCGFYYSVLEIGGEKYYSEVFCVKNFKKSDPTDYVKIEISNSTDLSPLIYKIGSDKFVQNIYLDTFVHVSEPEIEEEMEKDGNDKDVPVFQKLIVRNRMQVVLPDFINIALSASQLHDEITVTTEQGKRKGFVDRLTLSSAVEDNGSYITTDILLEQDLLVKTNCDQFIKNIDDETEARIEVLEKNEEFITFTGNAPTIGNLTLYYNGSKNKSNFSVRELRKGFKIPYGTGQYYFKVEFNEELLTESNKLII